MRPKFAGQDRAQRRTPPPPPFSHDCVCAESKDAPSDPEEACYFKEFLYTDETLRNVRIILYENSLAMHEGTDRTLQGEPFTIKSDGDIPKSGHYFFSFSLIILFPSPGLVPLCVSILS
jgi:hypothetical protein